MRPQVSGSALGRNLYRGGLLGTSWALLAGLEDFLGSFWFPGTPQASILEGSGTCWARFWKAPGECFGMPFSAPRTSLRNALINAVTTLFHLPALLILPSGAAVCAQHMELVPSTVCQGGSHPCVGSFFAFFSKFWSFSNASYAILLF